ncbi:zinc ribbon domain-containing protein [Streptomyces sp. Je 1-79]|uniref:NADase-type glycan-binding domain-containing protein n=1 Tax=Streptomyces sp. Je 1-79 TaxID=2943847 RepID=UPI0027E48AD8|nr:zinc ribbon domain-containing protein [Streptomyces sp. Je 1-79]
MQPAKPVARRPTVRPAARDEPQEGPPCPSCGTPNAPERRFCRRCAARLQAAEPVAALPWWRTVWPFRRRVRGGGSGRWLRRTVLTVLLLSLVAAGFLLLPAGRFVYEDVRDKLGKASPISPVSVAAGTEVPRHQPALVTDGLSNTYWGTPEVGDSVSFTFRRPFRLVDVVVHTGVSKKAEDFRGQARPVRMDLVVTAEDGTVRTKALTLADKPGPQTIQTGYSDVVSVRLVIREAAGLTPGRHVALAEVEFFRRS